MTHAPPLAALALMALPLVAQATEGALPMDRAIALATQASRDWCAAEGGQLALPDAPATAVDLTGDGSADDWIVAEEGAFCGPDLGYLGGSGGAMIHAVIADRVQSWLAGGWTVQDLAFTVEGERLPAFPVLVLGLHGTYCDSFGAAPCLLALSWDGSRLIGYAGQDGAQD